MQALRLLLIRTSRPALMGPPKQQRGEIYDIQPPKKENARGERAFSVVDLGVSTWGTGVFYISTRRLWGAFKEPREFLKFL